MSRALKTKAASPPIIDIRPSGEIVAVQAGRGHNSGPDPRMLRAALAVFDRLDEAHAALNDERREKFGELKCAGFDPALVRLLLKRRRLDPDALAARDTTIADWEEKLKSLDDAAAPRARARAGAGEAGEA
jgi:uncharacterized protein (UPF0335 family)